MQFREQGKKIQCIRSAYDPESKRCRQKVVGTFDRMADKLTSVGLEGLTDAERGEMRAWFDLRQLAKVEKMNQTVVMSAGSLLSQLSESIKATGSVLTDPEAAMTWTALAAVAKALRKAGHPKPKRKGDVVVSGQADLWVSAYDKSGSS